MQNLTLGWICTHLEYMIVKVSFPIKTAEGRQINVLKLRWDIIRMTWVTTIWVEKCKLCRRKSEEVSSCKCCAQFESIQAGVMTKKNITQNEKICSTWEEKQRVQCCLYSSKLYPNTPTEFLHILLHYKIIKNKWFSHKYNLLI